MKNLDTFLHRPPSPLQAVESSVLAQNGLQPWVKRDDLLHPQVSGNKWRKLRYNLLEARRLGLGRLVTFGGAYSNHIAAVAAAGKECGFSTVGVIRGEAGGAASPTLGFATECGMELSFASRADFKDKSEAALLEGLGIDAAGALVLPQGGANCLALRGCQEIVAEVEAQLGHLPDYFIAACGTGATVAGIASGLGGRSQALGVAVLKGGFLQKEVENLLAACGEKADSNFKVMDDFHHGGYAKWTPGLVGFLNDFKRETGIPLDPIYTGKAMFATLELARAGYFPEGASIVFVHTGGLQGIAGFNQRFGDLVEV